MSERGDQERERILRQRAERLAQRKEEDRNRELRFEVALLAVGAEQLGIPSQNMRELIPMPPLAMLPGMPPWLRGLTQIRGELISVVDLACWLDVSGSGEPRCLAVVDAREGPLGLAADGILGFRRVYSDDLTGDVDRVAWTGERAPVLAVTHDLVSILDIGRLASDPRMIVG